MVLLDPMSAVFAEAAKGKQAINMALLPVTEKGQPGYEVERVEAVASYHTPGKTSYILHLRIRGKKVKVWSRRSIDSLLQMGLSIEKQHQQGRVVELIVFDKCPGKGGTTQVSATLRTKPAQQLGLLADSATTETAESSRSAWLAASRFRPGDICYEGGDSGGEFYPVLKVRVLSIGRHFLSGRREYTSEILEVFDHSSAEAAGLFVGGTSKAVGSALRLAEERPLAGAEPHTAPKPPPPPAPSAEPVQPALSDELDDEMPEHREVQVAPHKTAMQLFWRGAPYANQSELQLGQALARLNSTMPCGTGLTHIPNGSLVLRGCRKLHRKPDFIVILAEEGYQVMGVVEVDGAAHNGRHLGDEEKQNELEDNGIVQIKRVSAEAVLADPNEAATRILNWLRQIRRTGITISGDPAIDF